MIASRTTFRLPVATSFLMASLGFQLVASAADQVPHAGKRISIDHARTVATRQSAPLTQRQAREAAQPAQQRVQQRPAQPQRVQQQPARQQRAAEPRRVPRNTVRQSTKQASASPRQASPRTTSQRTTSQRTAQPNRVSEPTAGAVRQASAASPSENRLRQVGFLEAYGSGCGPVCDCAHCAGEPLCGVEEIDHEPGCGYEVGCGIGAALEHLGPAVHPGCGVEACNDCYESACGIEGVYVDGPGCGIETMGDCSCDACSSRSVDCIPVFFPLLRIQWLRFDLFAGVQGYKGPLNFANTNPNNSNIRSGSGSFGFFQGFNEGRSFKRWCGWDMAGQFGARFTQSSLSGAEFTEDTRNQVFVTGGLFRRVDYGLQYGLVVDYLNDDWYFQGDSVQLRGELSWQTGACHSWGFQFMAGVDDDTSSTIVRDGSGNLITSSITFEPTDQYRLFYRRQMPNHGQWNAFAGWTDRDDGIIGGDIQIPLRRHLAFSSGATFLIPKEGDSSGGNEQEGWNLSMGLVFRPGGFSSRGRYCRPLFDVADNGTFMIDRK